MNLKTLLLFMATAFALQCCNNNSKDNITHNVGDSYSKHEDCYVFINGKDSILMELNLKSNKVTGHLMYNFYEKDDNLGTLSGEVHGDTIFAMYNFDSEGQTSKREVAFLKKGNTLVEGFGEIEEKNGEMTFKNRKFLNFDSNIILNKTDCY